MAPHHHHHQHHHRSLLPHSRKAQEEEDEHDDFKVVHISATEHWLARKPRSSLLRLLFIFLFFTFLLIFISRFPLLFLSDLSYREAISPLPPANFCSPSSALCCDRSAFRTDICFLNGDIRTRSSSSSFLIFSNSSFSEERVRPYTRKWEAPIMSTINELRLNLRPANLSETGPNCDVHHNITAVVFSTGGYTGNVYHEFNDGLIPLYLTSRRFNRRVIFLILEYHDWWVSKYGDVISVLSDFPAIDFSADSRTHCFPQAIVGLQIHDELAIDANRTAGNETMADFRQVLDEAYRPRIRSILLEQKQEDGEQGKLEQRPKLVVICRNGSRAIENESELAALAEEVGFRVELLRPERTTELPKIYMALNSSDVMIGVHGAAMTHLLFMRPGSVFIQIVPLGLDWAAETYYGQPAAKAKLRYESYRILARESSLSREYGKDDPVLKDPESVNAKGWEATKKVYLDGQRVRLDMVRFRKRLVRAYRYLVSTGKAGRRRSSAGNAR
ncbi:hypothetical protein IEQ34_011447 [Dendrobium chrysotoxum]|uniref:Glycosyltransferase 61 catalytic domain-containing protein n=1 Tax=Dendrobium chrysotoxum TaxID=161865 RepID=A0AAV7GS94_DENCH|nr:hypothetical protein IEQ34_011447 [Dendrobium chrysotoxum]